MLRKAVFTDLSKFGFWIRKVPLTSSAYHDIMLTRYYTYIICIVFALILLCPGISAGYGYKRDEDPIVTVFKSVIYYGKQGDWERVESDISTISDRIDDVKNIFDVNLKPGLTAGLSQHNFQEVVNVMANLVFLSIREKNYWNLSEELRMFARAKVRLRLAEEYYTSLLSGNVRKYDKLNGTKLHDDIVNKFSEAGKALGSLGFLGAGAVRPRPDEFEIVTNEIERKLLIVFPYFECGKKITY